jgi:very-short-patch-repair endonuclease
MGFQKGHPQYLSQFRKGHTPWNKGKKTGLVPKSAFKINHTSWNKGKKMDREKYPQSGNFKKHTQEAKEKNRQSHLGKVISEETRKKFLGRVPWNKGRTGVFSIEARKRMREARIGKYSSDHYAKMGAISTAKQNGIKEPTSIEKKLYSELKNRGLLFETQKLINGKFVVDAYIPSLNLIIEADGDYWHSLPKNMARDKSKNSYLKAVGFNLIRLSETEINNGKFKYKLRRILN